MLGRDACKDADRGADYSGMMLHVAAGIDAGFNECHTTVGRCFEQRHRYTKSRVPAARATCHLVGHAAQRLIDQFFYYSLAGRACNGDYRAGHAVAMG